MAAAAVVAGVEPAAGVAAEAPAWSKVPARSRTKPGGGVAMANLHERAAEDGGHRAQEGLATDTMKTGLAMHLRCLALY